MDRDLALIVKGVLVRETNLFIDEINDLMDNGVRNAIEKRKDFGKTQFVLIMNGIKQASSVEELCLFIDYQESKQSGWGFVCNNQKSVAKNVQESLNKIIEKIEKKILKELEESISKDRRISENDSRMIRLKIAEKYMGYLYWKATIVMKKR